MHTIKPFDKETFLEAVSSAKVLISLEEHSIYGGLGEMCASILSQEKISINFKILGIPDEYMINGSQSEVLDHYDMDPNKISELAKFLINK
jgi:transketolase